MIYEKSPMTPPEDEGTRRKRGRRIWIVIAGAKLVLAGVFAVAMIVASAKTADDVAGLWRLADGEVVRLNADDRRSVDLLSSSRRGAPLHGPRGLFSLGPTRWAVVGHRVYFLATGDSLFREVIDAFEEGPSAEIDR